MTPPNTHSLSRDRPKAPITTISAPLSLTYANSVAPGSSAVSARNFNSTGARYDAISAPGTLLGISALIDTPPPYPRRHGVRNGARGFMAAVPSDGDAFADGFVFHAKGCHQDGPDGVED